MNLPLALVGSALVAAGVIWRLKLSGFAAPKRARRIFVPSAKVARPVSAQRSPFELEEEIRWDREDRKIARKIVDEQRRSERLLLKVPIHIVGTYADGEAFIERTSTIAVNRDGAYIAFKRPLRTGDRLTITHLGTRQSCPFRVSDSHEGLSSGLYAWSVENLEPELNFWQIHFPERAPAARTDTEETVDVLLECSVCHSAEMAELELGTYLQVVKKRSLNRDCPKCGASTEWRFRVLEEEEQPVPAPSPDSKPPAAALPEEKERRREDRILAKLRIRLRFRDGRDESTMTENVSLSGVCCTSGLDLNAGDAIFVKYELRPEDEEAIPAHVAWRRDVGERGKILYGIKLEQPGPTVV